MDGANTKVNEIWNNKYGYLVTKLSKKLGPAYYSLKSCWVFANNSANMILKYFKDVVWT